MAKCLSSSIILKSNVWSLQVHSVFRKVVTGLGSSDAVIFSVQITNSLLALLINELKDYTGSSLWMYH